VGGPGPEDDLAGDLSLVAGKRVLVALSGGPDSTALMLWLVEHGVDVAAAHYDHALRGGSERDAESVAGLCERLGVPLLVGRRQEPLAGGSVQAAARTARYRFLTQALATSGRELVALGHTADDVVEGVVLHLLRGSGLAGMRGMPVTRAPFVRPFWAVWRRDIERFLAVRGVVPLRDPSNTDAARFARAHVRHELLPRLERDRPGLARRLWGAARAALWLQAALEEAARRVALDPKALRAAPRLVRLEVYRQLHGRLPALSRRQLEAMDEVLLRGRTGQGIDLPGGLRFRLEARQVSIDAREPLKPPAPALIARPCLGCDDPRAAHLRPGQRLSVGYRTPGLRMRPLAGSDGNPHPGTRKLQDILTDAKVPRHLRDLLPLVFADGRLAWVPGVAVDADAAASRGGAAVHVALEEQPQPFVDWTVTGRGM
jgi:tRNA(Ile)-lysidine synthase